VSGIDAYGVGATRGFTQPGDEQWVTGLQHSIDVVGRRVRNLGLLVTPGQSIDNAIHVLPETGGRIILGEGEHIVRDQIRVKKPVAFVSFAPNRTTVRRTEVTSLAIFWADSPNVAFDGITFSDEAKAGVCVRATGDNCVIKNCVFKSFKYAVHSNQDDESKHSSWSSLINNRFVGPGLATVTQGADGKYIYEPPVNLEHGNQWVVHGNHFGEWTADTSISDETNVILGGATFSYSSITTNIAPTAQIKYKGGFSNGAQANVSVVVVY